MLKTGLWGSVGCALASLLCVGCSEADKTKTQGESVASCDCPIDWAIPNSALCVAPHTTYSPPVIFSSHLDQDDNVACDPTLRFPQPVSSEPWSTQSITSRCTGQGTLTLRVRQGKAKDASVDDCILAEQTLDFDYTQANKPLALPPVAAWSADDAACSRAFEEQGGYFEFRVQSEMLGCGAADEKVHYVDICLASCRDDPTRAGCEACSDRPDQNRL
jgi:hypothetical protein